MDGEGFGSRRFVFGMGYRQDRGLGEKMALRAGVF
jgi:hypothetical protein